MYNQFPKISYADAMLRYGSDKPDLRNPLVINNITDVFERDEVSFKIFTKLVKSGSRVRCIVTKDTKEKPRSFFDNIDKWAKARSLEKEVMYKSRTLAVNLNLEMKIGRS